MLCKKSLKQIGFANMKFCRFYFLQTKILFLLTVGYLGFLAMSSAFTKNLGKYSKENQTFSFESLNLNQGIADTAGHL